MESFGKLTPGAFQNVFLSCLFCFLTGSLYSLGVFSTSVEEAASPSGSLDGVWSAGMALLSAFTIPSMFFGGVYLSQDSDSNALDQIDISKSNRARLIAAVGSISYALLAFGGYGVAISSALLIRVAFISAGNGLGLLYLLSMELLATWVPHRPGLAVGIGQMMYGLGNVVGSSVFSYLLQNHSIQNALYIVAAVLSLPTAAAIPFVQWPSSGRLCPDKTCESDPLMTPTTPLSVKELAYLPSFWIYFVTIFSMQSGYAFIAYYFKIGQTFGKDVSTLVTSFQVATIAGTLSRPLAGALADIVKTREGFFSMGSKNMLLALLLGQIVSFMALVPVSWDRSYEGYAFFAGTILMVFAAASCCVPLLAREQFGTVNSSVVYGTAGSVSMGLGEIAAVMLMAAVESSSSQSGSPSAYQGYYIISLVWSLCGLATCILLKSQKDESGLQIESTEDPKTLYDEIVSSGSYTR